MSAMERTKSESEVSMKDVDDEEDVYDEVKPIQSRQNDAINDASFFRRKTRNRKLSSPKTRWKLTPMTKRQVRTFPPATGVESTKYI